MGKEFLPGMDREENKKRLQTSLAQSLGEYLSRDPEMTVSEAQIEAYEKLVDALPEGRLKELAEKLKGVQRFASKTNETVAKIQDKAWQFYKPFAVREAPIALALPGNLFTKIAVKTSKAGGVAGEWVVKGVVKGTEKVKSKITERKAKKKIKITDQ